MEQKPTEVLKNEKVLGLISPLGENLTILVSLEIAEIPKFFKVSIYIQIELIN